MHLITDIQVKKQTHTRKNLNADTHIHACLMQGVRLPF